MSDFEYLSFRLPEAFIDEYKERTPNWGFPIGGGDYLGELTFVTKYSRLKDDGTKERWWEVCRRCVEGYYSILKDHCKANVTPWNEFKAQKAAQDAYERMFTFKWTPPGRGIWMMGTEFVHARQNSAALQNCAFISTEKLSAHSAREATMPFVRLMEMSMLGIGVGFDTKGAGNIELHNPSGDPVIFQISDDREGWCESLGILLETFFFKNRDPVEFDYELIRPAGEPIKGFGGTAAGPQPLMDMHNKLTEILGNREGEYITSQDIVDIQNLVGKCVVAGNVRRSAEIAIGDADDDVFLNLKNHEAYPERNGMDGWAWTSNNSVYAEVGKDYGHLAERIADNGEPGLFFLDLSQQRGRLIDPPDNKDWRAAGTNPCAEQTLESYECCTLVETFPFHHESVEDYERTLKHAYLYAKAVTLLPTHWPETNEVMQRNRRIGCSLTGVAQFVEAKGWNELKKWMNKGYEHVQFRDKQYSEWLGVRQSIKTTSVKPSGTVSLLAGATPGVHWPVASEVYIRRIRFHKDDVLVEILRKAGYKVEVGVDDPKTTVVVEFPTVGPEVRTERDVSMWEKAELAAMAQRYWADNQVSVTITFKDEEKDQIGPLLNSKNGQLKSVSLLPLFEAGGAYAQMPYEKIDLEQQQKAVKKVKPINWNEVYDSGNAADAEGEKFCANDVCELPV